MIEPDEQVAAIGSGGEYALAAAQALMQHTVLPADQIAIAAMNIAANLCIYTNEKITMQCIDREAAVQAPA